MSRISIMRKRINSVNQNRSPGEWYHVAGTFDGTTLRSYLNGLETDTNHLSAIKSSNTRLLIGQDGWGNIFNGTIDELKIYNLALSVEEVRADYEAGFVELNPAQSPAPAEQSYQTQQSP